MGQINGRAAVPLGQTTQVQITDVVIAPALVLTVERDAGGLMLAGACLRVVDVLRGRAIFSPVTPQTARTIAGELLAYADQETKGGG